MEFHIMPAAFFGHGSPMNAIETNRFTSAWKAFGQAVPAGFPTRVAGVGAGGVASRTRIAVLTMGGRDMSFDQDLPAPLGLSDSTVTKLNDQRAYLQLGGADRADVGAWLGFGISHPCTVFDKWQAIPVLDDDRLVVDLIRTFL
jgi:D-serine deaminase-like pyridoxal phosphate-dependent protein